MHLKNFKHKVFLNKNILSEKHNLNIFEHKYTDHLRSTKLRNLYKITTLKRFIFIIERNNSCKVCIIIKMINKPNH